MSRIGESRWLLVIRLFSVSSGPAFAHGGASGIVSGFTHPLSGWDHLVARIALSGVSVSAHCLAFVGIAALHARSAQA